MQYYIMVIVCVCAALVVFVAHYRSFQPYLSRNCQGFGWRRAFPDASADNIRSFLNVFGTAFGFRKRHLLKFAPTDGLMQIHSANNPFQGVDALEFESLAVELESHYGFALENAWHPDLTLGELFARVHGNAP